MDYIEARIAANPSLGQVYENLGALFNKKL